MKVKKIQRYFAGSWTSIRI